MVGVDVDPELIAAAAQDHRGPRWLVADLAELDLPARGISDRFDVIVSAGNVMTFVAPSTRGQVLARLRAHLDTDGRAVIGFGAGRDYEFAAFFADAAAAGFTRTCCCRPGICGRSATTPTSSSRCCGRRNRPPPPATAQHRPPLLSA